MCVYIHLSLSIYMYIYLLFIVFNIYIYIIGQSWDAYGGGWEGGRALFYGYAKSFNCLTRYYFML